MKEMLKQKRVLFPIIFCAELVLILSIASIFNLETDNTLFGGIAIYVIFCTLVWFLIRIIKDHKIQLSTMKIPLYGFNVLNYLYFIIALIIFGLILGLIVALAGIL